VFGDAPQRATLQEAIERTKGGVEPWVWLTDLIPDCTRLRFDREPGTRRSPGRHLTQVVMQGGSGGHEVLVEAVGQRKCDEINSNDLYGVLLPMGDWRRDYLRAETHFIAANGEPNWTPCRFCGPESARTFMWVAGVGAVLLGLAGWAVRPR
jgi:hypothetical protein